MHTLYSCLMNGCDVETIKLCWELGLFYLCRKPEIHLKREEEPEETEEWEYAMYVAICRANKSEAYSLEK